MRGIPAGEMALAAKAIRTDRLTRITALFNIIFISYNFKTNRHF
jgi:hypothetical protein